MVAWGDEGTVRCNAECGRADAPANDSPKFTSTGTGGPTRQSRPLAIYCSPLLPDPDLEKNHKAHQSFDLPEVMIPMALPDPPLLRRSVYKRDLYSFQTQVLVRFVVNTQTSREPQNRRGDRRGRGAKTLSADRLAPPMLQSLRISKNVTSKFEYQFNFVSFTGEYLLSTHQGGEKPCWPTKGFIRICIKGGTGIESGTKSKARTATEIENGIGVKIKRGTGIRIKSLTRVKIKNSTGTSKESGNQIGIDTKIYPYDDEGFHFMSM
ncbi:hypothetical protein EVAR_18645_1 [Eumeta japonica]|uniref:Uncharacterized protein n=1 Tax=Eumeta variegata TaxID=151549 RepID=A0A4C1U7V5_EUMVA|nr:hypothetical protein EVAR_18645_1 [Eumeta japonica]